MTTRTHPSILRYSSRCAKAPFGIKQVFLLMQLKLVLDTKTIQFRRSMTSELLGLLHFWRYVVLNLPLEESEIDTDVSAWRQRVYPVRLEEVQEAVDKSSIAEEAWIRTDWWTDRSSNRTSFHCTASPFLERSCDDVSEALFHLRPRFLHLSSCIWKLYLFRDLQ